MLKSGIINYLSFFILMILGFALVIKILGSKNIFISKLEKIISDPMIYRKLTKTIKLLPYLRKNTIEKVKNELSVAEYSNLKRENSKSLSKYFISIIIIITFLFVVIHLQKILLNL